MTQNKQIKYPRLVAKSELATNKSLSNAEIIDTRNEDKRQEVTRKNFNYNVSYAYAMDGLSAYCTDNAANGKIHLLDNNFYSIRVTPDEWEQYCLGKYVTEKKINSRFWDNFKDIVKEPKTLVMITDEGTFLGEPIRILVKRNDCVINSHGGNMSNLQTWNKEQNRYVPLENATAIEYIQIDFFRPMFKAAVEDNANWLPLPRNLQAIIDYTELHNPELLQFTYTSRYDKSKIMKISPQTARKYFLYVNANTNFLHERMYIDAVDFWKCVNPARIRAVEHQNDEGKKYTTFHLKAWYEDKQAMECLIKLHRNLVDTNQLEGIQFTTCGVWYNQSTGKYDVAVYRQKPLNNAPSFIEYDEQKQIAAPTTEENGLQADYNLYLWEHPESNISFEEYIESQGATAAWNEGAKQVINNNNDDYNPFEYKDDYNPFAGYDDQDDTPPSEIPF